MSGPDGEGNNSSDEVGQRPEIVPPTMTRVSRNSPVPLPSSPEKGGETESQMPTVSPLLSQELCEGHREFLGSLCASETKFYC